MPETDQTLVRAERCSPQRNRRIRHNSTEFDTIRVATAGRRKKVKNNPVSTPYAPTTPHFQALLEGQFPRTDLSYKPSRCQPSEGIPGLIEREDFVDSRLDPVGLDRPEHVLKGFCVAHANAVEARAFHHERVRVGIAAAGQESDQRYLASETERLIRTGQSTRTADFNHVILVEPLSNSQTFMQ